MIISELIIAGLLVWLLLVLAGKWYRVGHGGTVSKTLRLEMRPAHDGGRCLLCGSWCLPEGATEVIAVLPSGRKLPVCDGCAADLSEEKIRQRLSSLACELQEQAQCYIALSRCKIELPDSEVSFREMVQSIKHQIWPGTEEANPRTVQRP